MATIKRCDICGVTELDVKISDFIISRDGYRSDRIFKMDICHDCEEKVKNLIRELKEGR